MYQINKIRADHVIDFAAEELKKYLRAMMPEGRDIPINYDPNATEGFRLGLLEDFGLPNEAPDPKMDDVIHIDTANEGGILAGSNPRSVLFAVYRFLKLNGCRFLFPGFDGEYIPHKVVTGQKYHKMADMRLRGHTTEGEPTAQNVLDYIDYHAKQELNHYAFYDAFTYHSYHYRHWQNTDNRIPEPITRDQVEQWKGLMESECLKRGMFLSDGGHHIFAEVLGFDYGEREDYRSGKKLPTEEQCAGLAMINGKRGLFRKDVLSTQACMSRPEFRKRYAKVYADYIENHPQVGLLNLGVGDASRNHCECPECSKLNPSDFLIMTLNELDEELTRRGVDTKLSFSNYLDMMFPPVQARIKNPDRYYLSWCPVTRSYTSSITPDMEMPEIQPYVRNKWEQPVTTAQCASYVKAWRKMFDGPGRIYEYHYWRPQFLDPGLMSMSRRIYEDVLSYKAWNFSVCIQDGSNKSFFPHGFHSHIYAAALMDRDCDYEAELEDYFLHLYGEKDWKKVRAYFDGITEAFDHKYMSGEMSLDEKRGMYYNPGHIESLKKVKELAARGRALALAHRAMPTRPQTVAYRLLERHAECVQWLAKIMMEMCEANYAAAAEVLQEFSKDFGRYETEMQMERYCDFGLLVRAYSHIISRNRYIIDVQ